MKKEKVTYSVTHYKDGETEYNYEWTSKAKAKKDFVGTALAEGFSVDSDKLKVFLTENKICASLCTIHPNGADYMKITINSVVN